MAEGYDFQGRSLLSIPISPDAPGNPEHAQAVMAVLFVDAEGNPIDFSGVGGGVIPGADQILYTNPSFPAITTLQQALDQILSSVGQLTFVPMTVSLTGGGTYPVGESIPSVTLHWSVSKAIKSLHLTSTAGACPQPALTDTSIVVPGPFTSATSFTLTAVSQDGTETISSSTGLSFQHDRYWGTSSALTLDNAGVLALNSEGASGRQQTKTFSPAGGYIYFAWPSSFGAPSFTINSFPNSAWIETTMVLTNAFGYAESFNVYRSIYAQNGSNIVVVVT